MSAAEQLSQNNGQNLDSQVESGNITIDTIRNKYRELVWQSRAYNQHDKKTALQWSEKETDAKQLAKGVKDFNKAEKFLIGLTNEYRKQFREQVGKNCIRAESEKDYIDWFNGLTDKEKIDYLKNKDNPQKSTDLHKKRRGELVSMMDPNASEPAQVDAGRGTRLPKAIRKQYWAQFKKCDLEGREELIKFLTKEHERLKNQFVMFPKEVQEKNKQAFVKATIEGREKLILKIKKELGQDVTKESTEKNEGQRLDRAFQAKIKGMIKDELLAPASGVAHGMWYRQLSLEDKRKMITESELDTRLDDRKAVRDRFYKLSPEMQQKHHKRFMEVDLDRREAMMESLENPNKLGEKGEAIAYTKEEMQSALDDAKLNPKLAKLLTITNIVETKFRLNERARRQLGIAKTAKAETVVDKAQKSGMKIKEQSKETIDTLNKGDKRVNHKTTKTAFSKVQKIKQQREKELEEIPDESGSAAQQEAPQQPMQMPTNVSSLDAFRDKRKKEQEQRMQELREEKQEGTSGTGEKLVERMEETEEVDEKMENAAEDMQYQNLHVKTLEERRDARDAERHEAIDSEQTLRHSNAKVANVRYFDKTGSKELNMDEFEKQVKDPQREEANAALVQSMMASLPGADKATVLQFVRGADIGVDERKVAA